MTEFRQNLSLTDSRGHYNAHLIVNQIDYSSLGSLLGQHARSVMPVVSSHQCGHISPIGWAAVGQRLYGLTSRHPVGTQSAPSRHPVGTQSAPSRGCRGCRGHPVGSAGRVCHEPQDGTGRHRLDLDCTRGCTSIWTRAPGQHQYWRGRSA